MPEKPRNVLLKHAQVVNLKYPKSRHAPKRTVSIKVEMRFSPDARDCLYLTVPDDTPIFLTRLDGKRRVCRNRPVGTESLAKHKNYGGWKDDVIRVSIELLESLRAKRRK